MVRYLVLVLQGVTTIDLLVLYNHGQVRRCPPEGYLSMRARAREVSRPSVVWKMIDPGRKAVRSLPTY